MPSRGRMRRIVEKGWRGLAALAGRDVLMQRALLAALVGCLAPYLYLAQYANPSADDFALAAWDSPHVPHTPGQTYVAVLAHQYNSWNGHYASNLLQFQNPLAWGGILWYHLAPVVFILATLGVIYALLDATLARVTRPIVRLNLSLGFLLFYLYHLPTLAEGIYWYTGAAGYQAGGIVAMAYLAGLARFLDGRFLLGRTFHAAGLAFLLFFAIGFNEPVMILLLAFQGYALYKVLRRPNAHRMLFALLLATAAVGAAAFVLAPGNAVRARSFHEGGDVARSVAFTLVQTVRFFFAWVSSAPLLVGSLLVFPVIRRLVEGGGPVARAVVLPRAEAGLLLGAVFVACTFPNYWVTGVLGQHRTMNMAYFFFIPVWLLNLASWAPHLPAARTRLPDAPRWKVLGVLLVVASMATTANGYDAAYDLVRGTARAFDKQMEARYAAIDQAREAGKTQVTVEPLTARPATLYVLDLTEEGSHWINQAWTAYFGINVTVGAPAAAADLAAPA